MYIWWEITFIWPAEAFLSFYFVSPPRTLPLPRPSHPYIHTYTHTHTHACTHAYTHTHTTNKLSKFPRKSINEKKMLALHFWLVSHITPSFGSKSFGHHIRKIELLRSVYGHFPSYYIDSNINFCLNSGRAACNIMTLELKENSTLYRTKI